MKNVRKNILLVVVVVMMISLAALVSGCDANHKASPGSSLVSLQVKLFESGNAGTETGVALGNKTIQTIADSNKPSFEEKSIALKKVETNTEVKKQLISSGLVERTQNILD